MDKVTLNRILDVQEMALADETYQELYAQYQEYSDSFLDLLNVLPDRQQMVLEDFLSISAAMHLRLMELAVRTRI